MIVKNKLLPLNCTFQKTTHRQRSKMSSSFRMPDSQSEIGHGCQYHRIIPGPTNHGYFQFLRFTVRPHSAPTSRRPTEPVWTLYSFYINFAYFHSTFIESIKSLKNFVKIVHLKSHSSSTPPDRDNRFAEVWKRVMRLFRRRVQL